MTVTSLHKGFHSERVAAGLGPSGLTFYLSIQITRQNYIPGTLTVSMATIFMQRLTVRQNHTEKTELSIWQHFEARGTLDGKSLESNFYKVSNTPTTKNTNNVFNFVIQGVPMPKSNIFFSRVTSLTEKGHTGDISLLTSVCHFPTDLGVWRRRRSC